MTRPFLDVRDLRVRFRTDDGVVKAVDGLSYSLERGSRLGIVGESGSGKSVSSLAIMGLHRQAQITGEIWLGGEQLVGADPERVRSLRGRRMAMIFQDPLSALHPYYTVGAQIVEGYRLHHPDASKRAARAHAVDLLGRVGIPQPSSRVDDYPHNFSGGMRQRAMIAMALANNPDLLIADEPTTALDVTVQAQILDLILDLQAEFDSAVMLITHDLGVVADVADRIAVMYAGRIVEQADVYELYAQPGHPYTKGLLDSVPVAAERGAELKSIGGSPPDLHSIPSGCVYQDRCPLVADVCRTDRPALHDVGSRHLAACHFSQEVAAHV